MDKDILDRLKATEEEMEARLAGARKRALSIREEAIFKAKEIKERVRAATEAEIDRARALEEEKIAREAKRIEEAGVNEAQELRKKAQAGFDRAVRTVIEALDVKR